MNPRLILNPSWRFFGSLGSGLIALGSLSYVSTVASPTTLLIYSSTWGIYSLVSYLWDYQVLSSYLYLGQSLDLITRSQLILFSLFALLAQATATYVVMMSKAVSWIDILLFTLLSVPSLILSKRMLGLIVGFREILVFLIILNESLIRIIFAITFVNDAKILILSLGLGTVFSNLCLLPIALRKIKALPKQSNIESGSKTANFSLFVGMLFFGVSTLGTPWILKVYAELGNEPSKNLLHYVSLERASLIFLFFALVPFFLTLNSPKNEYLVTKVLLLSFGFGAFSGILLQVFFQIAGLQIFTWPNAAITISNGLLLAVMSTSFLLLRRHQFIHFLLAWVIYTTVFYGIFVSIDLYFSTLVALFLSQSLAALPAVLFLYHAESTHGHRRELIRARAG